LRGERKIGTVADGRNGTKEIKRRTLAPRDKGEIHLSGADPSNLSGRGHRQKRRPGRHKWAGPRLNAKVLACESRGIQRTGR